MGHIDALSRAPTDASKDTVAGVLDEHLEVFITMTEEEQVMAMKRTVNRLKSVVSIFSQGELRRTKADTKIVKNYLMENRLLYKEIMVGGVKRKLWAVPNSIRKSVVVRLHDLSGHFSVDQTVYKIRKKYYFPRMRRYVRTAHTYKLLYRVF